MEKKKKKWHGVCLWMLLLLQGLWWQWGCCSECRPDEEAFLQRKFDGTHFVILNCSGNEVSSVYIREANTSNNLVSLIKTSQEENKCITKEVFASCKPEANSVSVLVTDLEEGERREYQCEINEYVGGKTIQCTYVINIKREESTTPSALTTRPTETETEEKPDVATSGKNGGVSSALFIVVVVAMIILVVICSVLGWIICKEKRRKRKSAVDPDSVSFRSGVTDKSFRYTTQAALRVGAGGRGGMGSMGTLSHQAPTSPAPSMAAPEVPGEGMRLVMNYQRPFNALPATSLTLDRKDPRQLYENAVQYQEPWSSMPLSGAPPHATSTLTRSPNPHLVKIPDVSTTTPPGEDTDPIAPPTQGTDPASIEDSAFSE
ncbi:uncharacterized protein LOC143297572 isoform X2 [Babylonia areolata]|uniref:uncharacterized protein LOC143297572 isoform X2 n=1 Tax=Babylonia areolata TaxID=304850 RepID=UPI003FCF956E